MISELDEREPEVFYFDQKRDMKHILDSFGKRCRIDHEFEIVDWTAIGGLVSID
jgi:hypothetical protein